MAMTAAAFLLLQVMTQQPQDSVYGNTATRHAVETAAVANARVPATLRGYRAHLETEMALILVDTAGRERIGQIEQLGGRAVWNTETGYTAFVDGYRSQTTGLPFSATSMFRNWSLPMLYGQRLMLGIEASRAAGDSIRRRSNREPLIAVHPFAADRAEYYRFEGGDTVATLQTPTRRIPIIRIQVIPQLTKPTPYSAFEGEIDLDGDRHEIVRMRGQFVVSKAREQAMPLRSKILVRAMGITPVAYVEFTNAEFGGRYWLPVQQRIEFQAYAAIAGGARSVVRIVSRFADYALDESVMPEDSVRASLARRVVWSPRDSLSAFQRWRDRLGVMTESVSADDFLDIGPPTMRATGPAVFSLFPRKFDRAFHYDRVEGLYTGMQGTLALRDVAPGVVLQADAGYAWSERTIRGGLSLARSWSRSKTALVAERRLAGTQDFLFEMQGEYNSLGAILGSFEEADYVDRYSGGISHIRTVGSAKGSLITGRLLLAQDRDVDATLREGFVGFGSDTFLPNRNARDGRYGLASLKYEFHPHISGEFMAPGFGASAYVESAVGQLAWTRTELTLTSRHYVGPFTFLTRLDGAAVLGNDPPPQTLLELGGVTSRFGGYPYKYFAGDQGALLRGTARYAFPLLTTPIRWRRRLLPNLSPGISIGASGGWIGISSPATWQSILELGDGTEANALSRATGHIRSTGHAGFTFFQRFIFVGVQRRIDIPAPWAFIFSLGG